MWEDRESRKYVVPHGGGSHHHHPPPSAMGQWPGGGYGNRAYDNTEDLHAWSIYRQNLNADLSESAIGVNKSSNTERPFGNFQLKETTMKNILNHPKYGPRLRDYNPATYLKYGLPRVKVSQSEIGIHRQANGGSSVLSDQRLNNGGGHHGGHLHSDTGHHHQQRMAYGQPMTSDSASITDDDEADMERTMKRKNVRRTWKSDPDLLRAEQLNGPAVEATHYKKRAGQTASPAHSKYGGGGGGPHNGYVANGKAVSETDLRFPVTTAPVTNGYGPITTNGGLKNNGFTYGDLGADDMTSISPKYPHLIVRGLYYELDKTSTARRICGAQRTKLRVLDNISFEVKAGEVLAIMATNEFEGTSILEILSNRYNKSRGTVKSEITLNGIFMTPAKLSQVTSYVSQDTLLCQDMSARQTLLFSSLVQGPAKKNTFDTKKRTNAVLEELGLSEVRHTSVADLTEAERRRLLIAMSLLLDTDVLLLDQPTKGMDIFDSFFLIEYLRQWALISGRCVVLTIQPPTYEIFTMLSQIALISTGRVLYFGKRKDLLSYFTYIDFPCPAYKNPSDYYLDLVTLDNLSSEAMLESSERIANLVDLYANRCSNAVPLPGPPSVAPPPIRRAHTAIMFLALWIRALIFTFPYNVIHLFRNLFLALSLSILTGIIYWHVRVGREQEHLWDRIGMYHTILAIMPIPLFLVEINDAHKEKNYALNEIKMGLYTKPLYIFSKILYTLPKATLVFMGYAIPVSSMAGLQNNLLLYLVLLLGYLHTVRMIAISMAWTFDKRSSASIAFGLIFTIMTLASGTTFHNKDLSVVTKWLYSISPVRYTHEVLIGWEFHNNITAGPSIVPLAYQCTHNPIIQQENAILIKADCGFQQREHIMRWFNYKATGQDILRLISQPFITYAIFFFIFLIIGSVSFCLVANKKKKTNLQQITSLNQ